MELKSNSVCTTLLKIFKFNFPTKNFLLMMAYVASIVSFLVVFTGEVFTSVNLHVDCTVTYTDGTTNLHSLLNIP